MIRKLFISQLIKEHQQGFLIIRLNNLKTLNKAALFLIKWQEITQWISF